MATNDEIEDFTSAAAFPQRSIIEGESGTANPTTETTQRQDGPNFFRDEENVPFDFTKDYIKHTAGDTDVVIQLCTERQLNRTTQTHNTVMHQFLEQSDIKGSIFCRISFPTVYIFRVQFARTVDDLNVLQHEPEFPTFEGSMLAKKPEDIAIQVIPESKYIRILTTEIELRAEIAPFNLKAYWKGEKTPFWSQRRSDLFTRDIVPTSIVSHQSRSAVFEAFSLRPGECIYGLGERFDAVNRIGRKTDFVNHDAIGTSNTRTYINVPFFWSSSGWGCFLNSLARTEFDVGVSEQGTLGFGVEETWMDYFIIGGPEPKDILARYTQDLTGCAPILPVWTFGLWLSRNSYQSWEVVDEIIDKCQSLSIPLDDIHLDTFWFKTNWNPDYIFDDKRFKDPETRMDSYKKAGVHVSLWSYNCAPPRDDNLVYREGLKGGFFATNGSDSKDLFKYPNGTRGTWTDDAVIDFSNPGAVEWYTAKMKHLISQGASAIKTDFGDCVPPSAHYQRIAGPRFQNQYSLSYTSCVYNAIKSVDSEAVIWARPGTAGSQRYPIHWGGDSQCSWSGLQGTLKSSLSIGLSGFSYHSHDIGGFIGKPSPELYIRWAQFGLLSSHSRAHGAGDENGREPWFYGEEAVEIFRKFAQLKYRLLPYIVEQARQGVERGLPLVRAMVLEFPHDRSCWHCEEQYMFGEALLVAPILQSAEDSNIKNVYLPKGVWYDFWTKEKRQSTGEWIVVLDPPLDKIPIWVRSGTVLPYASLRMHTFNTLGRIERVEVYGAELENVHHGHEDTLLNVDTRKGQVTGKEDFIEAATQVELI